VTRASTLQNDVHLTWRTIVTEASGAFRKTWAASPPYCLFLLATTGVSALVPALTACAVGRLVGTVQSESHQLGGGWSFAFWLSTALGLLLLAACCKITANYVSTVLSRRLEMQMSHSVLLHLATLDQEFFEDLQCQDKLDRARSQPGKTCFDFMASSLKVVAGIAQLVSILAVLLWIDVASSLLLAVLGVPTFLIHQRLARLRYQVQRNNTTKRRWTSYYLKTCTSHLKTPTLKILGLFPVMADRFKAVMNELAQIDNETGRKQALAHAGEAVILVAGLLASASWIGYQTFRGLLSVESFVTYWVAAAQFRSCLTTLHSSAALGHEKLLHIQELRSFFTEAPQISPQQGTDPERLHGRIRLQNVTFSYRGGRKPAVRNVNLEVKPGEVVAIVGPNGAGKTTLVKLILRLYNISDGAIYVDGFNLRDLQLGRYHQQVGYVGHSPIDFEATVTESIAYGDWERLRHDSSRAKEVARSLGLDEMIAKMPAGYETKLGRRFGEYDLSAGQWQKLAIARALAREPSILILDEPTANLDARYEFDLLSALRHLAKDRTTIIISHRLATLRIADRIVVMDDGQIVDSGMHEELIERPGIYAQLYQMQHCDAA